MCWTCETTAPLLHWLKYASASQVDRFRQLVQQRRIGAGAGYLHLTPLCTFEQLVRSLQPIRMLRESLGLPLKVAIHHDVNGLPWPITQSLLDAGVELLMMGINVHFGGFPLVRPLLFRWQGADGRPLLSYNGEHYNHLQTAIDAHYENLDAAEHALHGYLSRLALAGYGSDFLCLTATHSNAVDNNPPPDAP
ncbi:MAG: hypothetical protein HC888_04520, partial [Candidatus Competibacteraceae bacterium]|nr:hypothetical protein [Candidatus Competibacteraceae bacterium]